MRLCCPEATWRAPETKGKPGIWCGESPPLVATTCATRCRAAAALVPAVLVPLTGVRGVLVFLQGYYRGAGITADVALILSLLILLGFMAAFEALLTAPGIAGVIVTVGMGVDSSVLIFERIR